jgi:hypothetical protein
MLRLFGSDILTKVVLSILIWDKKELDYGRYSTLKKEKTNYVMNLFDLLWKVALEVLKASANHKLIMYKFV